MEGFLSTFVFILPGIMAYFWLQVFGVNPTVKHTAPELSGISALLWLPVSFTTLFLLNLWGKINQIEYFSVYNVITVSDLNKATSDIRYIALFLTTSLVVSFFLCWTWSLWGNEFLRNRINRVRKSRGIAFLSSSASVWEEFFIRVNNDVEKGILSKDLNSKKAVLLVYKIDKPDDFIAGSMTKASRPFENDKSLVLEDSQEWTDSIKNDYDYSIKRVYVDIKAGMVIKELDYENPRDKQNRLDIVLKKR